MRKGQKIKLLTNVGKLKKNEIVTVTAVDYALRMAFIKNDKGISESVDNNFSNYQLMNDSNERLKTYKIKNHDSGQTFRVKAVSYADAKMKYNQHILKDSITEDAISKLVQNYLGSKKPKTKAEQDEIINFLLEKNKITKEDVQKVRSLLKIVKDSITEDANAEYEFSKRDYSLSELSDAKRYGVYISEDDKNWIVHGDANKLKLFLQKELSITDSITEDAYVYPTNASTSMAASFAKQCVTKFGGRVGSKGGNKYVYIAQDKETANKAKQFLEEKYKTSLPTVEFIVADSLTEDAAEYTTEKYKGLEWGVWANRSKVWVAFGTKEKMTELAKRLNESDKKQQDSITEDANVTRAQVIAAVKAKGLTFTAKALKELDWNVVEYINEGGISVEKWLAKIISGQSEDVSDLFEKTGSYKKYFQDADIAQNDIKSSYLPEDANADNIQYLGFNEKRKLSFYGYGDRYFVHYDLEGRTEEIDKATVQKILKKNILGEIDENDLINKEPQAEEIVSDSFDWKKQEGDDR